MGVQHRMRPEIARLIVPAIYPTLENHSSVLKYPAIRGLASNIFFLTHSEPEIGDHEGKSHLNPYEAQLSLTLARHLIMQGYTPKQITILTTYSGQLLHFFKIRREQPAVQSVRISVVDNFQGEENDIIILSLVRSNEDENIGFLRIENRICVALSRAKQGFYMIGNMQNLQGKSKLWSGISKMLESNGQIGPDFCLKCDIHDVVTKVSYTAIPYKFLLQQFFFRRVKWQIFHRKVDAWKNVLQLWVVGTSVPRYVMLIMIGNTPNSSAKKTAHVFALSDIHAQRNVL